MKGIDVSENNGPVDWQSVADAGMEFAIVRLGYGNRHLDGMFADHINGAIAAGLKIGVYYYSYALTPEQARNEANFVVVTLQQYGVVPSMGVWFDMEDADGYKERNGMPDNITEICKDFIDTVNDAGYQCGLYASYSWLTDIIDTASLECPVWNAQYNVTDDYPGAVMWQYTDSLEISGHKFDGNEWYG